MVLVFPAILIAGKEVTSTLCGASFILGPVPSGSRVKIWTPASRTSS